MATITVGSQTVHAGDQVVASVTGIPHDNKYYRLTMVPPSQPAYTDQDILIELPDPINYWQANFTWLVTVPYYPASWQIRLVLVNPGDPRTILATSPTITQPDAAPTGGALVVFPSPTLELLAGPLTTIGGITTYDKQFVYQAQHWMDWDLTHGYNYGPPPNVTKPELIYDRALVNYMLYYRTGKPQWLTEARWIEDVWATELVNAGVFTGGDYEHRTLSSGVTALEAPAGPLVTRARGSIHIDAFDSAGGQVPYKDDIYPAYANGRQAAYILMAFITADLLGVGTANTRNNARIMVDAFEAMQNGVQLPFIPFSSAPTPNLQTVVTGQWSVGAYGNVYDGYSVAEYSQNYMNGLVMEALALYDRAYPGDARCLTMIQRCADWMWSTQWDAHALGFGYANISRAQTRPSYPDCASLTNITDVPPEYPYGSRAILNGLILPAFGYLYLKTGDPKYKTQGDQILNGMEQYGLQFPIADVAVHGPYPRCVENGTIPGPDPGFAITQVKEFSQQYRSSSRYMGYLAQVGVVVSPSPTAPTVLTATATSATAINLAWTDNANNESGFAIERALGAGAFAQIASVGADAVTYTDSGLAAATAYSYRVRAYNAGGYSAYTNTATATTQAGGVTPPTAPTGLTATVVSATAINLAWTDASTTETGFKVERQTGTGAFGQIGTVAANVVTYADTGLTAATAYTYQVRAYNSGGDSAYSSTASATTQALPPSTGAGSGCGPRLTWRRAGGMY
jgi:hypothetical protein